MHKTNNRSRTMIPYTNSGFRAVILTQKEPSANNEPRATNKPRATSEPRAMNLNSNTKRINPKRDLQIASGLNGQQSINPRNKSSLRLGRNPKPTFKV